MKAQDNISPLTTRDLSIGYRSKKGTVKLFEQINFKINSGELVGLVGPNGIGKSTLIRTLCKVQPPLSGDILINQKSVKQQSSADLASELSIVLTDPPASRTLRVREIIALGRHPYTNWIGQLGDRDLEIIQNAMRITQTEDLSERRSFELSDGQLQRVMIARALAQDTPLIILDEPTTHLDLNHKARILTLLKSLTKDAGKSILFSSHEIDLAIQLSDKLIVMTTEKVYFDTPDKLIAEGIFDKLFPTDRIEFDDKRRSFRIKN